MAFSLTQTQFTLQFKFKPLHINKLLLRKSLTTLASMSQGKSKRPICPSCSKPTRTCLCSRILTSPIPNSVHVTILQHALECNHPLNSTRIARMGLKNLTIATVSDVNFESRFLIQLFDPNSNSAANVSNCLFSREIEETQKLFYDKNSNLIDNTDDSAGLKNDEDVLPNSNSAANVSNCLFSREIVATQKLFYDKNSNLIDDTDDSAGLKNDEGVLPNSNSAANVSNCLFSREIVATQKLFYDKNSNLIDNTDDSASLKNDEVSDSVVVNDEVKKISIHPKCDRIRGYGEPAITVTIGKYGAITSLSQIWMLQYKSNELSFDDILSCSEACEALSKGFMVKKLQKKQLSKEENVEECDEFELEICSGSVLLFPSDNAVSVGNLEAIGFEVKNLIVLDGTWAKAKRIYSENPWLNILPHLKLEVNEKSLYGDVRNQPKAGYLSTIESIVFALKAIGENHKGLDNLLDTFESMVGDQRRCKDERLSKVLPS